MSPKAGRPMARASNSSRERILSSRVSRRSAPAAPRTIPIKKANMASEVGLGEIGTCGRMAAERKLSALVGLYAAFCNLPKLCCSDASLFCSLVSSLFVKSTRMGFLTVEEDMMTRVRVSFPTKSSWSCTLLEIICAPFRALVTAVVRM